MGTLDVKRGQLCGDGRYRTSGMQPEGTNAHRETVAHSVHRLPASLPLVDL
jgi:hypothetical protein